MKYTAMLLREMSQVVEFEAPDDTDPDELLRMAADLSTLDANISNDFEESGDVQVFYVKNDSEQTVASETGEEVTS